MTSYNLNINAIGSYITNMPGFEIWADGMLISTTSISSNGENMSQSISFGGSIPTSLEFRFDDAFAESGRSINIRSVSINDRVVNIGNFLPADVLNQTDAVIINVAEAAFLFDDSEPELSEFTTDATQTFTSLNNVYRNINGLTDQIFDLLEGNDSTYLGIGNDKINGGDGRDILYGGAGNDLLFGGDGDDRLYGQNDDDHLYGGAGKDRLYGHNGHDFLHGGAGNDKLIGAGGDDTLLGMDGNDMLNGGAGDDTLYGDAGNDNIVAGNGLNTADGGAGNDVIYGGSDNDILNGGTGDDFLIGGQGDDILSGDSGDDILMGQAGADTLYSGSQETLDTVVQLVLDNNAGVVYNGETNSFYQFVNTTEQWTDAQTIANAATLTNLTGVNGHLVTITSQVENDFIATLSGASTIWLGASDSSIEGNWIWTDGPEANQQLWLGGIFGNSVNNLYSNWAGLQPGNITAASDYASFNSGDWSANAAGSNLRYVIEWEADSLLPDVSNTLLNGGAGADTLYGDDGIDVFLFRDSDAVDTIYNFDVAGHDAIDISDIIAYDPLNGDLNDFVQFTESVGNTMVSIDADGTTGGSSYTDIALLDDVTGLDLAVMIAANNLIV